VIPSAITKGDLDLLVRVPVEAFEEARGALGGSYAVHQLENWTPTFASFKAAAREPEVGIHVVIVDSPDDLLLRGSRDALLGDPALLERYNALKREHEGADPDVYWRAKTAFFEEL
ncbi:MAG TPA: GrpB family protein, partial [Thermoleophilaceae bacterium]